MLVQTWCNPYWTLSVSHTKQHVYSSPLTIFFISPMCSEKKIILNPNGHHIWPGLLISYTGYNKFLRKLYPQPTLYRIARPVSLQKWLRQTMLCSIVSWVTQPSIHFHSKDILTMSQNTTPLNWVCRNTPSALTGPVPAELKTKVLLTIFVSNIPQQSVKNPQSFSHNKVFKCIK